jgi:hypothetical protein
MLDDENSPYLWGNDELTYYADRIQKILCSDFNPILEKDNVDICDVALTAGDGLIQVDRRITSIQRARIAGQTSLLKIVDSGYMDAYHGAWDLSSVTQDTPTKIVTKGVGYGQAYLYPPIDTTGTLELVVYRMPLEDLEWALHQNEPLELERFAHFFHHGILYQAYLKQDTDTYDPRRAEQHRILWEGQNGRGGDKDKIRRMLIDYDDGPSVAGPMPAFM